MITQTIESKGRALKQASERLSKAERSRRYKVLCEHCGGETVITEKVYQWQQRVRCLQCEKLTLIDTDSEIINE